VSPASIARWMLIRWKPVYSSRGGIHTVISCHGAISRPSRNVASAQVNVASPPVTALQPYSSSAMFVGVFGPVAW